MDIRKDKLASFLCGVTAVIIITRIILAFTPITLPIRLGDDGIDALAQYRGEPTLDVHVTGTHSVSNDDYQGFASEAHSGNFFVVDIEMTNISDKSLITSPEHYFYITVDGRNFPVDSIATIWENQGNRRFVIGTMDPGYSLQGSLVFDLSEEYTNEEDLRLYVREDFRSPNGRTIPLN